MSEELKRAIIESLKEILRVSLMSAVGLAILQLQNGELDYRAILVATVVSALRGIDKLLHEYGKNIEDDTLKGGLTRF